MKTTYERTQITVTEFETEDVIITSGIVDPTDAPPVTSGGNSDTNTTIIL